MNVNAYRNSASEPIMVTLYLSDEEARKLATTLRVLLGDDAPTMTPQPWKPIKDRPDTPRETVPKPPVDIRAEIQRKLGR